MGEAPTNTKIFNLKINYNSQIKSPPNITTKFYINRLVPISSFLLYTPDSNPTTFISFTNGTFTEYINMYYDSNDTLNKTNKVIKPLF